MSQLNLKTLKEKLELVVDKNKQVFFDDSGLQPRGFCSWRGSYNDLCLDYKEGSDCYDQMLPTCKVNKYNDHDCDYDYQLGCYTCGVKKYHTDITTHTAQELLDMCNLITDKVFIGYKGGDFIMTDDTDIWVSTYGQSEGYSTDEYGVNDCQVIVDVIEEPKRVILKTIFTKY